MKRRENAEEEKVASLIAEKLISNIICEQDSYFCSENKKKKKMMRRGKNDN